MSNHRRARWIATSALVLVAPLVQLAPAAGAVPAAAHLVALNARTGHQQWITALPMDSTSTPMLSGGTVVVAGTTDCRSGHLTVVGVDTATGRLRWRVSVGSLDPCSYSQLTFVSHGVVLTGGPYFSRTAPPKTDCAKAAKAKGVPTSPVAISVATGHVLWRAPVAFASGLGATPTVAIGTDVNVTCLIGLDLTTGKVRWARNAAIRPEQLLVAPTGAVLSGQKQPSGTLVLQGISVASGKPRWTATISKPGGSTATTVGDVVTVLNAPDTAVPPAVNVPTLVSYDPANGRALWRAHGYEQFTGLFGGPGGVLIHRQEATESPLTWLNARTGKQRWSLPPQGRGGIESAVTDGTLVAGATANTVVGLSAATGARRWTTTLENSLLGIGPGQVFVTQTVTPKNPPGGD
jgi:outer membrane protein assembly factor BamB